MKVTVKGQVTIPKEVRDRLGIKPLGEVEFMEEQGRVYLVRKETDRGKKRFTKLRGSATAGMSTEEIMRLTRGEG